MKPRSLIEIVIVIVSVVAAAAAAIDGEDRTGIQVAPAGRVHLVPVGRGLDGQRFVALTKQNFAGFKAIEGDATAVVAPEGVRISALIKPGVSADAKADQSQAWIRECQA